MNVIRQMLPPRLGVVAWLVLLGLAAGSLTLAHAAAPAPTAEFVVEARQFSYEPATINVAQGQRVHITLRSMDVTHGLHLDDYGAEVVAIPGRPQQLEFVADKSGAFRFRCTQTCGQLHPFMIGKVVVAPNTPFQASLALAGLVLAALLGFICFKPAPRLTRELRAAAPAGSHTPQTGCSRGAISFDLLAVPLLGRFLRWRGFQFALMLPLLFLLIVALVAGFRGSPVGSHNFAVVFVWVVWWALLIIVLLPLGGRAWCAACPVPAPGEWLQRRSFIQRRPGQPLSLGKRWPAALRNIWLQNAAFLIIALFSAVILTTPVATAIVLATFFVLAIVLSLTFAGRAFCRYVCPLGGFIGLCSLAAPLAVRVKDEDVCRGHLGKECINGSEAGYGCPWFEYPGSMRRNAYCGLCMECVKTCPKDNIAVGFQSFGRDLLEAPGLRPGGKGGRVDEAFRVFIALGSAALYSAVMLGPWGWLKSLAGNPLSPGFALYAGLLLGASLLVVPGLFLAAAALSARLAGGVVPAGKLWRSFAYGLVPLALMAWIAFSLSLIAVSGHYLLPALSDPLGRGWNLFGTAGLEGGPVLLDLLPYLQTAALVLGLAWSTITCWHLARRLFPALPQARRALLPIALVLFGTTATFLWLFLG